MPVMFIINEGSKETDLCVFSYNSRGFGALKQGFCNHLSSRSVVGNKIPILCNQENFILRSNSYKLNQALPNFHLVINPAEKGSHCKGRPRGGMFIAVPDYFKNNIQDVSPGHWRLQAILVKTEGSIILLINSYFPVDPRTVVNDENELNEIFQNIRNIFQDHQFSSFLLCGDINCDFLRNTGHVKAVQNFIDDFSLTKAWDNFNVDFTHSQENQGIFYTATLDHFFWNVELSSQVLDAGVIHSADNNSDHCPVYCVIKVKKDQFVENKAAPGVCRPSWKRASEEEKDDYKHLLSMKLDHLEIPDNVRTCRDVHCKDINHNNSIDIYVTQILNLVEEQAKEALPVIQPKSDNQRSPNQVGLNRSSLTVTLLTSGVKSGNLLAVLRTLYCTIS